MAIRSRSALEFLRREGLVDESARPAPRLSLTDLLVHTVPLSSPPLPGQTVLREYEGQPPPDRGVTRPWPGTQREA
jgi:hypothetical protein